MVQELLLQFLHEVWEILFEAVPYLIFGFFMAGLLKAFIPDNWVAKHLGKDGFWNVIKASLIGIPLPLCSCGVVPTAAGIRKQGASKGATASFLVSTPETGVDSIAITYGLMGPIMMVIRPLSAFLTAVAAGISINLFDKSKDLPISDQLEVGCCSSTKNSSDNGLDKSRPIELGMVNQSEMTHDSSEFSSDTCGCSSSPINHLTNYQKFKKGMHFAFVDLVKDIALWFMIGIALAALISMFLSPDMIETYFGNQYLSMALMLIIATPLYVCATSSTPIAAAFLLKGVSPGAVLVFLLAGPATNAASIAVINKVIGKKATAIYLANIMIVSVIIGLTVDAFFPDWTI
ncbi:MAG: SO_0444 family Cu/Zn efflux transporter [Deltaproteobacteria bacterium]|nr:SO_0444 family Cu/Zn efflux transporter [Deltaproteobacteria bacterium]